MVRALNHLETFEARGDGALLAYLRQAILNRIRDEGRKVARRPEQVELYEGQVDGEASPLEELIGRETLESYESALERLRPSYREAVIGWVELGYSVEELQQILEKPSPDAARMTLSRALVRLAEEMGHDK